MKYIYRDTERDQIDEETGEVLATEPLNPSYGPAVKEMAKAMKKAKPLFKTPWNHDTDAESLATGTACPEISKAQQSAKEESDINTIVNRFLRTGELPNVRNAPTYAELAEIDFIDAMNQVNTARRSFDALPAKARRAFNDDPARFLAYVEHCLDTGDLKPLEELELAQIKTDEPAFEERLATAITKAYRPPSPPEVSPAPPQGGKGPPSGP